MIPSRSELTASSQSGCDQGRVRETATQYGRMMSSDVYFKSRVRELAQALEEG